MPFENGSPQVVAFASTWMGAIIKSCSRIGPVDDGLLSADVCEKPREASSVPGDGVPGTVGARKPATILAMLKLLFTPLMGDTRFRYYSGNSRHVCSSRAEISYAVVWSQALRASSSSGTC